MAEPKLLEGVLGNSLVPHQPLIIITYSPTFPNLGLTLFKQLLFRNEQSGRKTVLISALYPQDTFTSTKSSSLTDCIDLTKSIPGFEGDENLSDIEKRVVDKDALDILAEDYSQSVAIRFFRRLLHAVKDSKLLLFPSSSSILASLIPSTISPTLTLLTPHSPSFFTYLSRAYLTTIESSPKFWGLIESAQSRMTVEDLAYKGEAGLEVGSSCDEGFIVQVLVRKAQGGIKGISRSFEAIIPPSSDLDTFWSVKPVSELIPIRPITDIPTDNSMNNIGVAAKPQSHADLNLPFNLNLTDAQKKARMGVPLPYAHEGEGAGVELEFEDEDEEDEEI